MGRKQSVFKFVISVKKRIIRSVCKEMDRDRQANDVQQLDLPTERKGFLSSRRERRRGSFQDYRESGCKEGDI